MNSISIVLVHYSNAEITWNCIESLINSEFKSFNLFVVDNGSEDDDKLLVQARCTKAGVDFQPITKPDTPLQFNKSIYWNSTGVNLGYAAGINRGVDIVSVCNPDFLLLLNNDTILPANFLSSFIAHSKSISDTRDFGMAGCLIRTWPDKKIWYAGGVFNQVRCMGVHHTKLPQNMQVQETGFVSGCCMLIKPETYKALGGMDDRFFLYFEDVDLCFRTRQLELKLYFVPQVEIYHQVSSSTGGDESELTLYYSARNRIKLMQKHFSGFILFRFYLFFFSSRIIKTALWLVTNKKRNVTPLWQGIKAGFGYE